MKDFGRILGVGALTGYIALLFVTSWPSVLRPGAMEPLYQAASTVFRVAGISPGMTVFRFPEAWDEFPEAICLVAKARGHYGAERLWPDDDGCIPPGLRLSIPPRRIAYLRFNLRISAASAEADGMEDVTRRLEGLSRHFCEIAPAGTRQVDLLAYLMMQGYTTGERSIQTHYQLRYECDRGMLLQVDAAPNEAQVRQLWGTLPWL